MGLEVSEESPWHGWAIRSTDGVESVALHVGKLPGRDSIAIYFSVYVKAGPCPACGEEGVIRAAQGYAKVCDRCEGRGQVSHSSYIRPIAYIKERFQSDAEDLVTFIDAVTEPASLPEGSRWNRFISKFRRNA